MVLYERDIELLELLVYKKLPFINSMKGLNDLFINFNPHRISATFLIDFMLF